MDEELRAFLTEQFGELRREIDQQFVELRGEMDQRLTAVDQRIEAVRRELGVVVEGQQDQIRLIAEGRTMLSARLDAAVEELRRETAAEHRDTRAMIKLSYEELDRRMTRLEALTLDLDARVRRLEGERGGDGQP